MDFGTRKNWGFGIAFFSYWATFYGVLFSFVNVSLSMNPKILVLLGVTGLLLGFFVYSDISEWTPKKVGDVITGLGGVTIFLSVLHSDVSVSMWVITCMILFGLLCLVLGIFISGSNSWSRS